MWEKLEIKEDKKDFKEIKNIEILDKKKFTKIKENVSLWLKWIEDIDFKWIDSRKVNTIINFISKDLYKFEIENNIEFSEQEIDIMMNIVLEKLKKAEKDFSFTQLWHWDIWHKILNAFDDVVTNIEMVWILKEFVNDLKLKK